MNHDGIEEFTRDVLAHYADPNYDPRKRREYYLRTRQLKGRSAGSKKSLTDTRGRVVNQRRQERAERKQGPPKTYAEAVNRLTQRAELAIGKILSRLDQWTNKFAAQAEAEQQKIVDEVQSKIAALPEIPKYASPARKRKLAEARRGDIARIRGQALVKQETLRSRLNSERRKKRQEVKRDVDKIRKGLKAAIKKAESDFDKSGKKQFEPAEKKLQFENSQPTEPRRRKAVVT